METFALYLAARDPRTPWYAKLLAAGIVAYAFSPIDLIPDFVPVLGYLDDLILRPWALPWRSSGFLGKFWWSAGYGRRKEWGAKQREFH
jgi:uncharacterized membrane protein YkvA (DUF1232 family)